MQFPAFFTDAAAMDAGPGASAASASAAAAAYAATVSNVISCGVFGERTLEAIMTEHTKR